MGLPALLLAYAAGLCCAAFLRPELQPLWPALAALLALLWLPLRRRRPARPLLLLFFFTLGVALCQLHLAPPTDPGHIRSFVGDRPLVLTGTVASVSARPFGQTLVDLEAERVGSDGIAAPVHGRVRLTLDAGEARVRPGDTVRFRARLRPPRRYGTPGEFDYPRHLARQRIFVTAWLADARELAVFPDGAQSGLAAGPAGMRVFLGRFIDARLAPEPAPLVKALVIGDSGAVTPGQRDLLARGGVSHLFAISGQHLSLIAMFLYGLALCFHRRSERLLLLAVPRRALPLAIIPPLLAYLLLTGSALSARRAFLMFLAGALLLASGRRTQPLRILAAAALVILLVEPLALFEPSFQLSCAGVFGILLLVPRWQARLHPLPKPLRWAALLLLTTLSATIATTPLVLLHFHLLAPAALLTNLFAVPAVAALAMPLGLVGALLAPWWPGGAELALQGCALAVGATLEGVARVVAWTPLSGWKLYLSPLQLAGSFLLAAALLLPARSRRGHLASGLLAAAGALALVFPPAPPPGLTVTALSVGQGDSILLSHPDGRHYLIDGGGAPGDRFDIGERLVAPALGRLGVRTLEAVILTHDHPDHREGLLHVLDHFPVRAFWSPLAPEALDPALGEILRRRQIPALTFPPGWTPMEETTDRELAVFVPAAPKDSLNDGSLVLYARQGRDGILLTGDLEAPGVAALAGQPPQGPVTLLKLPHHGSRKSSPQLLLDRFRPQAAFVSAGAGNPYRLPHAEVVADLKRRGIPLFRTDRHGSVSFQCADDGWHVRRWGQGLFR
jgi:competence protein ComEC